MALKSPALTLASVAVLLAELVGDPRAAPTSQRSAVRLLEEAETLAERLARASQRLDEARAAAARRTTP